LINPDLEKHTDALAQYMPNGPLFEAKNIQDSNFRKLLKGFAGELFTAQGYLVTLEQEYFPDATNLFLSEWESALGIPDDCFPLADDNNTRRMYILIKLAALGVQTADDFIELGNLFDESGSLNINVFPLSDALYPPYNVPFTPVGLPEARYIIVVEGNNILANVPPYDVPFNVESSETILQCVLSKQKPSNCRILFRNLN